jgi:hypothetical protein
MRANNNKDNSTMIKFCFPYYLNKGVQALLLFVLLTAAASAATLSNRGVSTAFSQGATTLGVIVGSGSAFSEDYIILGASVGYYVVRGLELGLDVQHWFSGDPSISKVSPQVRYVFTQMGDLYPYLGAFYRRTYIESQDDYDSIGYRAGAYFSANNGVYIGGGMVYEEYRDCSAFLDCSSTYPEILISVSF